MHALAFVVGLVVVATFHTADAAGSGYGKYWDFNAGTKIGPSKWNNSYADCGGSAQSPINILSFDTKYNAELKLEKVDYDHTSDNIDIKMKNRNTDIAFEAVAKNSSIQPPQHVVLKGIKYRFYQLHFHWGSKNWQGSEHNVDSQRFAAEMHMIHYNTKYANITAALKKTDGLLVWGHFIKVDRKTGVANNAFDNLLSKFAQSKPFGENVMLSKLNINALLPAKHTDFYNYKGGLTTPGCHESVNWVVNRDPISLNEAQIELFRNLNDTSNVNQTNTLQDNFRPIQALNGRTVERNFQFTTTAGAAATVKPSLLFLSTVVVFLSAFL